MHWLHALYAMTALYFGVVIGFEYLHLNNPFECLVKMLTGIPCFSCGTTRAIMLLFEGKFHMAISTHPNVVIFAVLFPAFTGILFFDLILQKSYSKTFADLLVLPLKQSRFCQLLAVSYVAFMWTWNIQRGI